MSKLLLYHRSNRHWQLQNDKWPLNLDEVKAIIALGYFTYLELIVQRVGLALISL